MSVITVTVAGVDRTEFWHEPTSTTWEDPLNGRGTGSITFVVPVSSGIRFLDGQEFVLLEDGTPRFGGQLMEPEEREAGDNDQNAILFFNCQIADFNILADQRIVSEDWVDVEFSLIVSGVVTNWMYDEGISLAGVQTGAAFSIEAGNVLARDVFDTLADKSKRGWRIDEAKVLNFKDRDQDAAPFGMNGSTMLRGSVTVRPDRQTYRNWQLVEAGTDEFPILVVSGNATEIAARAALTGTSGRVEHLAQNLEITNATIAQEWTGELLDKYDEIGAVVVGKTRLPGFHAGQEVVVDFPNHDINTVDMLIDSVNAEIVVVGNEQEIWYTIRAITGDPYGGYQQHYRKVAPIKGPLRFTNEPGLFRVDPTPGVVIHDPIPGPFDWFQGATTVPGKFPNSFGLRNDGNRLVTVRTGGLANTDGCGGGLFPGFGGSPACFASRQLIAEIYTINADNTVDPVAASGNSRDMPSVGTNYKATIPVSPNNKYALVILSATAGVDSMAMVYDLNLGAFRGQVISTMLTNSNWSEPAWVGDVCYFIDAADGSLYMYDVTDPDNPTETVFATSVTKAVSAVGSPDGSVLYLLGDTKLAALDISSPLAPAEDTVLTIIGGYISLEINPDGTALLMIRRKDASNLGWTSITMTANDTDIAFSTNDGSIPLSTTVMKGRSLIWPNATTCIIFSDQPTFPANSLEGHVFDASNIDVVTYIETLSYTHGGSANRGPFRSLTSAKSYVFFGGVTQQVTFGEATIDEPVPLTIEKPLRSGFGGTGLGTASRGDIIYADRQLPDDDRGNGELTRLGIGQAGQSLVVSGELPVWADFSSGVEFADSIWRVFNVSDPTKELAFDASGITPGNTRELTVPDGDGTLILGTGLAGGQTLIGGTGPGEDLTLQSTAHATKGLVTIGGAGANKITVDELLGRIALGGNPEVLRGVSIAPSVNHDANGVSGFGVRPIVESNNTELAGCSFNSLIKPGAAMANCRGVTFGGTLQEASDDSTAHNITTWSSTYVRSVIFPSYDGTIVQWNEFKIENPIDISSPPATVNTQTGLDISNLTLGNTVFSVILRQAVGWNLYAIGAAPNHMAGNFGLGTTIFGTSGYKVLAQGIGTAPTSSPGNIYQQWCADLNGAGTAGQVIRDETGAITRIGTGVATEPAALTLGVGVATFAVKSDVMKMTGDGAGNTITTITGGLNGQRLTLIFADGLISLQNDDTHAADTIDLPGSSGTPQAQPQDTVVGLVYDGISWFGMYRSTN